MEIFQPADAAQAREVIIAAAAATRRLEIIGGGSKRSFGRPSAADAVLDVSRLSSIVDYEPSELTLTVRAATPMAEILKLLDESRQMLAFEPMDWLPFGKPNTSTLGGVLACNIAGPRRVRAGAARDHFLGFTAVNGRGEIWKAGGKVVKNVTGYDMSKLQCGAFGTLSLLTEVTVKVMPKPETSRSVVIRNLAHEPAIAVLSKALNSPFEVSAAAHLPSAVARRAGHDGALTVLRIEGPAPSVAFRAQEIARLLGMAAELDDAASTSLWRRIGGVDLFGSGEGRCLWRICPTPSKSPSLVREIAAQFASAEAYYDWGGGLVWLSLDLAETGTDAGAAIIRGILQKLGGGHATLVAAAEDIRAAVPVFEPEPVPHAALTRRIKDRFDPSGILNPGRMQKGV